MEYPDISFMEEETDSRQFVIENENVIVGRLNLTSNASKIKKISKLNVDDPVIFKKGLFRIHEIIYDDFDNPKCSVLLRIQGKFSKDDPNGLKLNDYSALEIEVMSRDIEDNSILGLEV